MREAVPPDSFPKKKYFEVGSQSTPMNTCRSIRWGSGGTAACSRFGTLRSGWALSALASAFCSRFKALCSGWALSFCPPNSLLKKPICSSSPYQSVFVPCGQIDSNINGHAGQSRGIIFPGVRCPTPYRRRPWPPLRAASDPAEQGGISCEEGKRLNPLWTGPFLFDGDGGVACIFSQGRGSASRDEIPCEKNKGFHQC